MGRAGFAADRLAVVSFRGNPAQSISSLATGRVMVFRRTQRFRRIVDACPGQHSAGPVGLRRWWRDRTLARIVHGLDALG